jgi:phenylalanyl-tRNA synthetase alpha chain
MDDLVQIVESAKADFAAAEQSAALEDAKAKYIGKNGAVTALMRGLA